MSTQYRITFAVTQGQEPVVWDEVFATGIITAKNLAMAHVIAGTLLHNAIGRHQESLEDPEIDDDDVKDCHATVEPLSDWVKRGIRTVHEIRGWTPEEKEDA